jgi:ABC-type polysaccharide/polyol phosphate export permease
LFIKDLIEKRFLIAELTKRDFKAKYASSVLGIIWAFLEPLCFVFILWFIFTFGMKGGAKIEYLVTGLIPFSFFRSAVMEGVGSISAYSFLVKKVDFRMSILAVAKLLSNVLLFFLLTIIIIVILLLRGVYPSFYWLQYFYYLISVSLFVLGIVWFTSAIEPFWPDIKNIISILLQFLFYLTPVFWKSESVPERMLFVLKLNPLYYIINGFRESFFSSGWFWDKPLDAIYFWSVTSICLISGILLFRKMRPHFADVIG